MNRRRRNALPHRSGPWTPRPRPEIRPSVLAKFSSDPGEQPLVVGPGDAARIVEQWPECAHIVGGTG